MVPARCYLRRRLGLWASRLPRTLNQHRKSPRTSGTQACNSTTTIFLGSPIGGTGSSPWQCSWEQLLSSVLVDLHCLQLTTREAGATFCTTACWASCWLMSNSPAPNFLNLGLRPKQRALTYSQP